MDKGVMVKRYVEIFFLFSLLALPAPNSYAAENKGYLLEIKDTKIDFIKVENFLSVYVIGKFVNTSDYAIKDIVIESQFLDINGNLIDVATEDLNSTIVPAHGEAAFKILTNAIKNEEIYKNYTINILSATEDKPYLYKKSKLTDNIWIRILISWTPMLLLVAVWVLLMRKYSGKKSPQQQSLLLIEKQNELFEQQNSYLKSIAEALNNKQQ